MRLLGNLLSLFSLAGGDSGLRERRDCFCFTNIATAVKHFHLTLFLLIELHAPALVTIARISCVFVRIVGHRAGNLEYVFPKVSSVLHSVFLFNVRGENVEIGVVTAHDQLNLGAHLLGGGDHVFLSR